MSETTVRLSQVDCETPEDFLQYYKNRLFALKDKIKGDLQPTVLYQRVDPNTFQLKVYPNDQGMFVPLVMPWKELRLQGLFGRPLLGNTVVGDSYVYLWDSPRRESVKGLDLNKLMSWEPDRYGLWPMINAELQKKTVPQQQLETARAHRLWHIYNPKFFRWDEAVDSLVSGQRVGAPISYKVGLCLQLNSPHMWVSYKQSRIGRVDDDHRTILLDEKFAHFEPILRLVVPKSVQVEVRKKNAFKAAS